MLLTQHLRDLLFLALVIAGPLPGSLLALFLIQRRSQPGGIAHALVIVLFCWCAIGAAIAIALGLTHHLTSNWIGLAEGGAGVFGLLALAYARRSGVRLSLPSLPSGADRPSLAEVLMLAAACCLGIELCWRVCAQPMTDWDTLAYHLPAMATWRQTGWFTPLEQYRGLQGFYPYTWEALCSLFLVPFPEDSFVGLPNLVAWGLLGIGICATSRQLGATRTASLAAGVLAFSITDAATLANSMHVDLQLASFLVIGAYFGLRYSGTSELGYLALWLAAVGMICGVKTSGLVYAALLASALAVMLIASRRARPARVRADRVDLLLLCAGGWGLLLLGGSWYLRNWVTCGNPLGCVEVRIGSALIFPARGPHVDFSKTALFRLFDLHRAAHWRMLLKQLWNHYHLSFFGLALLSALALFGRDRQYRGRLLALLAAAVIALLLYTRTPYSGDWAGYGYLTSEDLGGGLRYALPFVAALAMIAALGATVTRVPSWALAAIAIGGVAAQLRGSHWPLSVLLVGLVLGSCYALGRRQMPLSIRVQRWAAIGLLAMGLLLGGAMLFVARRERDRRRVDSYGYIVSYLRTGLPPGEGLGYAMSGKSYFFYGTDLSRRVVFIPLQSQEPEAWRSLLKREGLSVIAFGPMSKLPDAEQRRFLAWLDTPNSPLVRALGTDITREPLVYRLKPAAGS